MAQAVLDWAIEHERGENYIKEKIRAEGVRPGKYYPPTEEMKAEWQLVQADKKGPPTSCGGIGPIERRTRALP